MDHLQRHRTREGANIRVQTAFVNLALADVLGTLSLCPRSATIHHVYTCYMFTWLIADGHSQLSEWQIKILICGVTQRTVAVYRVAHIVYAVAP